MSEPSVTIFFEGRSIPARADASVAVALWEHGVRVLSHSPKYGRPRGLHCARGACMSCLMRVDGVPNVRSCSTVVRDGMQIERQDSGSFYGAPMQKALNATGHLMPVGFYYKWFTKPSLLNDTFMKMIRPLTGIGRLPAQGTWSGLQDETPARDLGLRDTIVIGAGLAGLSRAVNTESKVLFVDDNAGMGGQRHGALDFVAEHEGSLINGLPQLLTLHTKLQELVQRASERNDVEFIRATVVGAWQPDMLLLRDDDGLAVVRGTSLIWAAGAFDAFPLFDDHDVPGILGPRALYRLIAQNGLDVTGLQTVVHGHGIDASLSAALLHSAGAKVVLALDENATPDGSLLETAQRFGWSVQTGLKARRALSRKGSLHALEFDGGHGGRAEIPCEIAVIAARAKPIYDVPYQLGVDLVLDPSRGGYVPRIEQESTRDDGVLVTGEASGLRLEDMLAEATS